ncbi:hypothetical protein BACINT_00251 [Bacteroides intestinalis DSM 17393]|jgi:radical SAM superfamily enzyme|uniref:Uncharacterized protein n=1 Tax=Bacteroides intestinalis DSM 17393 TaxID=471870 RepID=B3C5R8_9BACE|nr:hypothetical protein [Bacteroides intestinalis]EDV07475.1 hypothetical protein BACINT_00251 [Bacteroides intestinalis DSM 17393]RHI33039.1 hypothetical protein DW169_11865 [Bacteroides intestinalis]
MEKVAFHHGEIFFPPWWKERNSTMERISVRMEKANRWKGKSIGMPKKRVSYWRKFISERL